MPFFQDVDDSRLIETHIRKVAGLEEVQAKVLLGNYRLASQRIDRRLRMVSPGTFTEAQLQLVKTELDIVIQELEFVLRGELNQSYLDTREDAVEHAVKEVNFFQKKFAGINQRIPLEVILESLNPQSYLVNQYAASIQAYNEEIRAGVQRIVTQSLIERVPYNRVVDRISDRLIDEQWKVHRIVRTELHNIYNISKMGAFGGIKEQFLPDLKKTLVHPMDARTGDDSKSLAQKNPIVPIDKPFVFEWNGQTRTFMAPPDRPNDRAILVPYREAWDKS